MSPPRQKVLALVFAVSGVGASAIAVYVDGRFPAAVPSPPAEYTLSPLSEALRAVDSRGQIDFAALGAHREALDRFVASLASVSPLNEPARFPTPEDKLAYWLNAYHALVLQQLLDGWPMGSPDDALLGRFWWGRSWPIGGQRLTLWSIEHRFLREAGDARVYLSRFTGVAGGPLLDGAPFDGATLDAQLDDASRRFMRRPENVALAQKAVTLSPVLREHRDAFLAALPPGRPSVLQIVWAFLPESCEGERPGCDTRADLDRACGVALDQCAVTYAAEARAVPARR